MEAPMSKWMDSEFREFLRARLMNDPDDEHQTKFIARLAAKMGMSPFTLYDILSGRNDLGFDRLPALVNALRDVSGSKRRIPRAILSWLVSRCRGFALIDLKADVKNGEIESEIDDVMVTAGELFADKVRALRDGILDEDERDRLYHLGLDLRGLVDRLLEELTEMKKGVDSRR
jgi:hypothetical protein